MKIVKLRGYVEANLGDDLFIEIICARYPNVMFQVLGSRRFKDIYRHISNLDYFSYDTFSARIISKVQRIAVFFVNKLFNQQRTQYTTDSFWEDWFSRKADYNVFIIGSGFMNDKEEFVSLPRKFRDETRYYKRAPYLLGCNFGPFYYNEYLEMFKKLFADASDICFRDSYSYNLFSELKQVRYASDIVLTYPVDDIKLPDKSGDYLLISVVNLKKDHDQAGDYQNQYISAMQQLINDRSNRGVKSVLVGFSKVQKDDQVIAQILESVENKEFVEIFVYPNCTTQKILELFAGADGIVATRYHAAILGILFGKRVCAISYNEKLRHVIKDISSELPCVELDELRTMSAEDFEMNKTFILSEEQREKLIHDAQKQFKALDMVLQ